MGQKVLEVFTSQATEMEAVSDAVYITAVSFDTLLTLPDDFSPRGSSLQVAVTASYCDVQPEVLQQPLVWAHTQQMLVQGRAVTLLLFDEFFKTPRQKEDIAVL